MLLHIVVFLVRLINLMAPKKKAKKKKTTKNTLERLEPPNNETDPENLSEVVSQAVPDPTVDSKEATLTRSMALTPKCSEKGASLHKTARLDAKEIGQVPITTDMEDELADWFEAHPIFFDQSKTDFKNWIKRDKLMTDNADELGMSHSTLWT